MSARTILNVEKPQTQTVKAVCGLLAWKGRSSNPLPEFVEMGEGEARLVLVLSNKRDSYYTVTSRECSCPAAIYNHGKACKHQRKYFPEAKATTKPTAIIMERKPFKPIAPDECEAAKVSASPSFELVDTLADPSPRDLAYHSIQEDRTMWPVEA